MVIQPSPLKPGETVGIMCPAGYMPKERTDACVDRLREWDYASVLGQTLYSASINYFSGTDEQRASDLQQMLDDDSIRTILFGRGGYGMSRIIDQLDFTRFMKNPKWIAGYSDITVLLAHLYSCYGISSLHSPMAGAFADFPEDQIYLPSVRNLISGGVMDYSVLADSRNKIGVAVGPLLGGNLALFTHLIGTPSFPETAGAILFLEDVGEQLYNIDRMLRQLKRSGKLEQLGGLIFGGFTECKDTDRPFGQDVSDILQTIASSYDFPVCYDFPVSHTGRNYPLKYGVNVRLQVGVEGVRLQELV
ncbi:MAG: LD-carboxypeptidase [Bacteroidetes bacterium]|nr:LD-carboxypeptidase [Bacteroidota bacterium]